MYVVLNGKQCLTELVTVRCLKKIRCSKQPLLCFLRPGDRVQVIDDSNEDWWKVGRKTTALHFQLPYITLYKSNQKQLNSLLAIKLTYFCPSLSVQLNGVQSSGKVQFIRGQSSLIRHNLGISSIGNIPPESEQELEEVSGAGSNTCLMILSFDVFMERVLS